MESRAERRRKDEQIRVTITQKLVETGEQQRLKESLRAQLEQEQWRDQVKERCKDIIQQKGLNKITVEDLVAEVTPYARAMVPDHVKMNLLQQIRKTLQQDAS